MRRFRAGLVVGLIISIAVTTSSRPVGQGMDFGRSSFALSVGQTLDEEGNAAVVINISVPYRRLVFLKRGEQYESRIRIFVNVKGGKGKQVRGEVWEESVVVEHYEATKSASGRAAAQKIFPVEPGKYDIEVNVEVVDTSLRYYRKKAIEILGRESGKFRVSDPVFLSPLAGARARPPSEGQIVVSSCGENEGGRFRPNDGAVYADFGAWPRAVFDLLAPTESSGNDLYTVSSRLRDRRGNDLLYNRMYVTASQSGYQRLCMDVNVDDLPIGDYEISVAVELPQSDRKTVSKGRFTVLLNRGALDKYFRETMEILSLYAEKDELEELAASTRENRVAAWNRFWSEKDPDPSSRSNESLGEFLSRLEHVLRYYSSFSPGWRTDRGKVYLRNGRPDDIVDRQGRTYGTNYQFWYYYSRGIVYIFEDMLGTGDYRLLDTRMI